MYNPSLESQFLEFAEQHQLYGIKGHRSVGGFRASIYNAMPMSSVLYLIDVMNEFESKFM
jgi:phosphoserine aminotransferase